MNIKENEASMNGFVDEIIGIVIDDPFWVERAKNVALLVIHAIFRPLYSDDPYQSANSQAKVRLPNTRLVWFDKSRPALYGYSYQEKNIQPGYKTSEHL